MCGGKSADDADLALEGQSGDVEVEGRCSRPAKTIFMIFNIIIWLGSCALLAFGIFGIVDSPFLNEVMGRDMMLVTSIVLIVVGGIGFIVSFIGCCGAIVRNKCLILTYVIILGILLAVMIVGGIISLMFSSRLEEATTDTMRKTLEKYDLQDKESPIVRSWDAMQKSLKCCGVMFYKDWETYNIDFKGSQKIPESCCVVQDDGQIKSGCTNAFNNNDFFSSTTDGCQTKIKERLQQHAPVVAIVAGVVAFFMILGIILGIVVYTRL